MLSSTQSPRQSSPLVPFPASRRPRGTRDRRIVIFTRYPEPGSAKTRLIPVTGEAGAAAIHRDLTEHTIAQASRFDAAGLEVCYTGAGESAMRDWLGHGLALRAQSGGDLGRRMASAFEDAFAENASRVVLVGTDSPGLGPETFAAAFDALRRHKVVLGPAIDGGYYLVGIRRDAWPVAAAIFDGVAWGTASVLGQTLERVRAAGLSIARTAPLADVDTPADLDHWRRHNAPGVSRPYLSVIVPTLNAGDALDGVLRSIGRSNEVETIVADGGSTDGTLERAKADGIKVIACPRGRAAQMNLASAHVSGDVLLFLHSDTMLPPGYLDDVRRTLSRPGVIAGAFRFKTDYPARAMRLVEWTTNLRSRLLQLPYGDQGLFMRVSVFRRLGGFRELPIMDDFDFVRRARRLGRIGCAPTAAVTSGKRWRRLGIWRTALRNQAIVALYYCGVSAERLAQLYRRGTEDDR